MTQDKIWDYFQTQNSDVFSGSGGRLEYLFHKILTLHGKNKPKVLNIGVGNGWLEQRCSAQGWETYALDPSETAIVMLKEKGISGKVGYIEEMPYPDSFFDVVFCSEVIEHLSDEQVHKGLQEIERVLKNSGVLIGTVPLNENLLNNEVLCPECGHNFHRWGHEQSFNKESLSAIFPPTLTVEKIQATYFIDWSANWTSKSAGLVRKFFSVIGVRNGYENLFFIVRKLV